MATEQDLVVDVLRELGVLSGSEQPPAEDADLVKTRYRQRLPRLVDENYADWSVNSIPDDAMPGLRLVIAFDCARPFGLAADPIIENQGLTELARLMRKKATYEPVRPDYF